MVKIDFKFYTEVGKLLKEYRNRRGYSLDQVCDMLHNTKTKSTLKRYEDGESRIDMPILEKLAKIYAVDVDFIVSTAQKNSMLNNEDELDQYGVNKREMLELIKDKPELIETYKHITENDNLALLFDAAQGLSPEDLEPVLILINGIRKNKGLEWYRKLLMA